MLNLIRNYDPKLPLLIGERFGYALSQEKIGYNYLAGGAGMIFSSAIVSDLMKDNGKYCSCPRPDEHDDMFFTGQCLKVMEKNNLILNSVLFHQYSPSDYSPELLKFQKHPISFHKFHTINAKYGKHGRQMSCNQILLDFQFLAGKYRGMMKKIVIYEGSHLKIKYTTTIHQKFIQKIELSENCLVIHLKTMRTNARIHILARKQGLQHIHLPLRTKCRMC